MRAWQRMLSGRRLDLLDPSPLDIEITDIALGLSRVARWNGQTRGQWAWSVAEHSLLVERLVGRFKPDLQARWRLAALLHDAAEYVVGDLITPFKGALGPEYKEMEIRLARAVHRRFDLPEELPAGVAALIKRADKGAAFLEATQLAGFAAGEARHLFGRPHGIGDVGLDPAPPDAARDAFLARFARLAPNAAVPSA